MKWKKKKTCPSCDQKQECSECKKYQDKAFELEVDEELQQEKIAAFWKKYRWYIYGGILLILLSTAGIEWYRAHKMQLRLKESDAFEAASVLAQEGKTDEAVQAFQKLSQSSQTGYRLLALMNLADLQMSQNKKQESLTTLKQVLQETASDTPLHSVASLSYVGYQLEEGNPDELMKILAPALENDAFQGLATELAVILLYKQNNPQKANELLKRALQNPALTPTSKARLNALKGEIK